MRFLFTLLLVTALGVVCVMALEATGVPVVEFITWGAAQVTRVVEQVELPAWVNTDRVEQVTEPVQAIVNTAVEWAAQFGGAEK